MYLRKNYIKTIDYNFETNTYKIIKNFIGNKENKGDRNKGESRHLKKTEQ